MSVESTRVEAPAAAGALRAVSRFTWRRPRLVTLGQVSAPVGAFLLVYVAALVALLVQSFWTTDSFTGKLVHDWSLDNFRLLTDQPYPRIVLRTVVIASAAAGAPRGERAPALGQLPRPRLLVAADPEPGRRPQLGPERTRAARPEHRVHELGDVAGL